MLDPHEEAKIVDKLRNISFGDGLKGLRMAP